MKQRVSVSLPAILNAWCAPEMIRPKNDKPSTVIIIIKVVRGTINATSRRPLHLETVAVLITDAFDCQIIYPS